MAAGKFARDFERVPEIEEVAPKDFVAIKRARDQQGRDRSFNSNVFLYKICRGCISNLSIYNTGLLDWRW